MPEKWILVVVRYRSGLLCSEHMQFRTWTRVSVLIFKNVSMFTTFCKSSFLSLPRRLPSRTRGRNAQRSFKRSHTNFKL